MLKNFIKMVESVYAGDSSRSPISESSSPLQNRGRNNLYTTIYGRSADTIINTNHHSILQGSRNYISKYNKSSSLSPPIPSSTATSSTSHTSHSSLSPSQSSQSSSSSGSGAGPFARR